MEHKFRCSSLGKLMTKSRSKSDPLSQTTKTYLKKICSQIILGRDKNIESKFFDKGIYTEEKSVTLFSNYKSTLFLKNKKRFSNDFITGEPDIITKNKIIELKSSWSFDTFPLLDTEIPNKNYYWQIQGYMALKNLKKAELIYSLNDTPNKLVVDELRRLNWKNEIFDIEGNVSKDAIPLVVQTVSNLIYTEKGLFDFCEASSSIYKEWFSDFKEVHKSLITKVFEVDYSQEAIDSLYEKIPICREYMNELIDNLNTNLKIKL